MNRHVKTEKRTATYQDVLDAPENMVAELIDGALHVQPRPALRHARASSTLGVKIGGAFDDGSAGPGGWWILDEPELHLGPNVLVPDLAGWRRERMPDFPDAPWTELVPDWTCEVVSPGTRRLDLTDKRRLYAAAGVAFLWLIDPTARTLEAFALRDGAWTLIAALKDDEEVRVPPFDAIAFPPRRPLARLTARPETMDHDTPILDRPPGGPDAYVTLVTNAAYLPGARALVNSLRRTGTPADIVILHTPAVAPESLAPLGATLACADLLPTSDAFNEAHSRRAVHDRAPFTKGEKPAFHTPLDNFVKLRLWQLPYARTVFLDADTVVIHNIDRLFSYPEFSAAPNVYESLADFRRLNSGVFTARPNPATYRAMLERLDAPARSGGAPTRPS